MRDGTAALLLRPILHEVDDRFGCRDPLWFEIAVANDAFLGQQIADPSG
jgi:hypothetical protein